MKKPDWTFILIFSCTGFLTLTAVTVMAGWKLHSLALIDSGISYAPMQFNTALCFLLCAGVLAGLQDGRRFYGPAISFVVLLFAIATLSQYLLGVNYGIDTLFVQPFTTVNVISPGRMAPNTALGFILSGGALHLCASSPGLSSRRGFVIALTASMIVALGAVPLAGYVFGIDAAYSWGNFIHMAPQTSFCFLTLGVALIVHTWRKSHRWEQWLPIPIFLGLAATSIALSGAVRSQEDNEFQAQIQTQANHLSYEAETRLVEMYGALERIAARWQEADGTPQHLWETDAQAYLAGYPFLSGLSVTDKDTRIKWIAAREPAANNRAMGFQLSSEPVRAEAVRHVLKTQSSQTTPAIELLGGGKGFLFISPLFSHGGFDGLQVAVFQINTFFKFLLNEEDLRKLNVTVDDGNRLFSTLPPGADHPAAWLKSAKFENRGVTWTISVSPTAQALQERNSFLPTILLTIGLFSSLLVTLCFFLALKWRQNAQILRVRELALEKSSSINNAILSSAAHLIVATDTHGTIIVFNPEAERTLGYTAQEMIGIKTPSLWHDKEEIRLRAAELSRELGEPIEPGFEVMVKKARRNGSEEREWTCLRKDKTRFAASVIVTPLTDSTGSLVGYLFIIQDITLRKRQEEALKKSEETFRQALEHASVGMALVSPTGMFVQVNKALCDIVGYSKAELLSLDFQTITHSDDLNSDLSYFYQMLSGDIETYQMEKRYMHKRGHIVDVLLNVSLVRNANNTPAYFVSQIQDITERKRSETELRASEGFNRSLMDASADCVMLLDASGRVVKVNLPGIELMEAGTSSRLVGRLWWGFWPTENESEVRNAVQVAHSGGVYRLHGLCPTLNGKPKWWDVQISPVWDATGQVANILAVSRDITESKQIETMKTEFISTVSHELRTPLTSIRGSLGLITGGVMGALPEKVQALVQIAYNNSERLVRLINNILDIEKIESGRMTFELQPVPVSALLRQAMEETQGYAAKYGIELCLDDHSEGAQVTGDRDRLLQVLGNLISNAIKYSPAEGKVTLTARAEAGAVRIGVTDKGAGIPDDFKSRIFGKFAQADSSDTRQKGGTGLGLSISRTIIESMNGSIAFESKPGHTEFYFTLPQFHSSHQGILPRRDSGAPPTILICEDDADITALLRLTLEKDGFGCDTAASAEEAGRKLALRHYAGMTLDLGLPDKDGIAFLRELRQNPATAALPIVVVSARAQEGKRTLNGDAIGILDWLSKPIDFNRLKNALRTLAKVPEGPSILHIEDDADIAQVITAGLEGKARVTCAATLAQAGALLEQRTFDLAILDMRLPDGSGTELLPKLSAHGLPVIILSVDEPSRAIQERVAASLVKSRVTEDKILQTIRTFMRNDIKEAS